MGTPHPTPPHRVDLYHTAFNPASLSLVLLLSPNFSSLLPLHSFRFLLFYPDFLSSMRWLSSQLSLPVLVPFARAPSSLTSYLCLPCAPVLSSFQLFLWAVLFLICLPTSSTGFLSFDSLSQLASPPLLSSSNSLLVHPTPAFCLLSITPPLPEFPAPGKLLQRQRQQGTHHVLNGQGNIPILFTVGLLPSVLQSS